MCFRDSRSMDKTQDSFWSWYVYRNSGCPPPWWAQTHQTYGQRVSPTDRSSILAAWGFWAQWDRERAAAGRVLASNTCELQGAYLWIYKSISLYAHKLQLFEILGVATTWDFGSVQLASDSHEFHWTMGINRVVARNRSWLQWVMKVESLLVQRSHGLNARSTFKITKFVGERGARWNGKAQSAKPQQAKKTSLRVKGWRMTTCWATIIIECANCPQTEHEESEMNVWEIDRWMDTIVG